MIYDYVRHFTKSRSRQRKKGQMKKKEKKNKNKKVRKKKLTWHNAMLTKATNYRLSLEFPEASLKLLSYFPFCRTEFMVAQNLWLHMTWITLCFRIELLPSSTWISKGIFKVIFPFAVQNLWRASKTHWSQLS